MAASLASTIKKAKEVLLPNQSKEKEFLSLAKEIERTIAFAVKPQKAILGGSAAKGTWLNDFDIDVFVLFDGKKYAQKSHMLSALLEKSLRKRKEFSSLERLHGSRDYFRITLRGVRVEIIPIIAIRKANEALNITDISPLHSAWVRKHRKLRDDMRLFKQFLRSTKAYGAESHIRGLSGYVCEILVAHYGSFEKLIRAMPKWKEGMVIDTQNHYRGEDPLLAMNKSKLTSPLIVVDPIQKERNASAALGHEQFNAIKERAARFLRKKNLSFFEELQIDVQSLKAAHKGCEVLVFHASPMKGKEDVAGARLLKAFEHIKAQFARRDFSIAHAQWEWDGEHDALFVLAVPKKPLGEAKEVRGPPLAMVDHAKRFKSLHKKSVVRKGVLYASVQREFTSPAQLAKSLCKDPYVAERCARIRLEVR